jgi:hypothetical protein
MLKYRVKFQISLETEQDFLSGNLQYSSKFYFYLILEYQKKLSDIQKKTGKTLQCFLKT